VATLVFVLAAMMAGAVITQIELTLGAQRRSQTSQVAASHAQGIQRRLERALTATYALAALVRQGQGEIGDFAAVATEMLPFYPGAASLQLAPDGVVRQIVPLVGNEAAIGHDLLADPARTKEAFLAKDTGRLTLAGPFELMQGGLGAVGRLPVFLDVDSGQSRFWGFTIVLLRFPDVLDPSRLLHLSAQGYDYLLWRRHPDTGERQIIAAAGRPLDAQPKPACRLA
jgi:sensor domain CHASE-containing protein